MDSRQVTVDAVGTAERPPDAAVVELRVVGAGESAGAARAEVRTRSATLRELLDDSAVDAIKTVDVEVEATEMLFEPATDAPYQATEEVHVDCSPAAAESVAVDATSAGANVRGVRFQLAPETRETLVDDALAAAMERAREKAERLAAAEGLAVGAVRDVTTTDASEGFSSIVDEALEHGDETNLHPKPILVSEGVEVVYELTSA